MYESFFGLKRRPFPAMPDAAGYIPIHATAQALSSLILCANEGRGIGVLTAPAGLGKTLVCQCAACQLEGQFHIVLLPSGNFLTRRSLLQAVLFELGHSYVRMGDQELRLALTSVLRRLSPGRKGIVVIVDEAHLLAPRMLEELRTLTNVAQAGEPVVRLIVSGQLPLEEHLSRPELDAFNQRVGTHVMLQPLTREESIEYMGRRLAWAGANVCDVFTPEAVRAVSEASDGSPRCIHQLCDHSLLLSYLARDKPVSVETIHEALEDVKQLPLTWNEPVSGRVPRADAFSTTRAEIERIVQRDAGLQRQDDAEPQFSPQEAEERCEAADDMIAVPTNTELPGKTASSSATAQHVEAVFVEFGGAMEFGDELAGAPLTQTSSLDAPDIVHPVETVGIPASAPVVEHRPVCVTIDEEIVIDRYAALDAAIGRLARTVLSARAVIRRREPVLLAASKQAALPSKAEANASPHFDVVLPEDVPPDGAVRDPSTIGSTVAEETKPSECGRRPYERLFSELRQRRKGA